MFQAREKLAIKVEEKQQTEVDEAQEKKENLVDQVRNMFGSVFRRPLRRASQS